MLSDSYVFFVNIYTGDAQWKLPRMKAPEVPPQVEEPFLACELMDTVPLAYMQGRYSAVSYCAGGATKTARIMLNGYWFNCFANLEHSIECIRLHWARESNNDDLLLWTDQICINQSDNREKSHQVRFMRLIYRRAKQVFVVLSTASPNRPWKKTATGMDALRRLDDEVSRLNGLATGSIYRITDDYQTAMILKTLSQGLANEHKDPWVRDWTNVLVELISAEWWTRAWVYQEFVVASRAYFIYRSASLAWPSLYPYLSFFCAKLPDQLTRLEAETNAIKAAEKKKFVSILSRMCFNVSKLREVLQATSVQRMRVEYFIESKDMWTPTRPTNLRVLLQHSISFKSTDVRDLVYAFIGLCPTDHNIVPDYTSRNTILHVLIAAAKSIVRQENNLQILDNAIALQKERYGMWVPSWVPDWTAPECSHARSYISGISGTQRAFDASKRKLANANFRVNEQDVTKVALNVSGLFVGVLDHLMDDAYGCTRKFRMSSGLQVKTTSSAIAGDQVWVLRGADSVYVLRNETEDDYSLLGAASLWNGSVISNIMYGDMIDREERGEVQYQEIFII